MRPKLRYPALVGAIILIAIVEPSGSEAENSFECPVLHQTTTPDAIQETAAQRASASQALSGPEQENAIRVIATELRQKYPNATNSDIVNYLETAYCPLVAKETGLSDAEKRARRISFPLRSSRFSRGANLEEPRVPPIP